MTALVMNAEAEREISRVRTFAEENPLSFYQMKKIVEQMSPPVGDDERFVCVVPLGYRCAFSIETHMNERTVRHLSVSVSARGKYPNPAAMNLLMEAFGFSGTFEGDNVLVRLDKECEAVEVIQDLSPGP